MGFVMRRLPFPRKPTAGSGIPDTFYEARYMCKRYLLPSSTTLLPHLSALFKEPFRTHYIFWQGRDAPLADSR